MGLKDALRFVCEWLEEDIIDMESSTDIDVFDMNLARADSLHVRAQKFLEQEYWTPEIITMIQECAEYIEEGLARWDFDTPAEHPDWYTTALDSIKVLNKSAEDAQHYFD